MKGIEVTLKLKVGAVGPDKIPERLAEFTNKVNLPAYPPIGYTIILPDQSFITVKEVKVYLPSEEHPAGATVVIGDYEIIRLEERNDSNKKLFYKIIRTYTDWKGTPVDNWEEILTKIDE